MKPNLLTLIRPLAIGVTVGLATWGTGVAKAANVLYNGDLDLIGYAGENGQANPGPLGWNVYAYKHISGLFTDGGDAETWCSVDADQPTPDGNDYGFFFKPFQGTAPSDVIDVWLYQDNPATPGTKFTFSGYPSCQANYCGIPAFNTNALPVNTLFSIVFLDSGGNIVQSNAYDLFAAAAAAGQTAAFEAGPYNSFSGAWQYTTPQVTAPANTATVRVGAYMLNAFGTSGNQSFFADYFDLESVAPAGSPIITNQPAGVVVAPGGTAHFSVGVSNPSGVTYQWQLNTANLSNGGEYSGVNSPTLTVTGASTNDVGHYRVVVSNSSGTVYSSAVPLALMALSINPVITIDGNIGDTYEVYYTTSLVSPVWIPLTTNKLKAATVQIVDPAPISVTRGRFYRAVLQ